jgi:hypothetical protein
MNQPGNTVLRLSFAGNTQITSLGKLRAIFQFVPNLIELDLSFIGAKDDIDTDMFDRNPRLGNLRLVGTQTQCWSEDVISKLRSNMKTNMKMFKHKLIFA